MQSLDPWKLNREDFCFRLTKGWSDKVFEDWLCEISQECKLEKDALFLYMLETIRKISRKTIEILEWQTKIRNMVPIPPFIITHNLSGYPGVISLRMREGMDLEIICDKERVLGTFGLFGQLHIETLGMCDATRALCEGKYILGITSNQIISYNQLMVREALEAILMKDERLRNIFNQDCDERIQTFIKTIAEETMHYFDYCTNPALMDELMRITNERSAHVDDIGKKLEIEQEIEKKLGLKDKVEQIYGILKNQQGLFSPLRDYLDSLPKINTP